MSGSSRVNPPGNAFFYPPCDTLRARADACSRYGQKRPPAGGQDCHWRHPTFKAPATPSVIHAVRRNLLLLCYAVEEQQKGLTHPRKVCSHCRG